MFTLRRLQYHYERDTRVYWNRILSPEGPELPEETYYYNDTDHSVCEEIAYHLDNGDLEFAFLRASGPSVRCKFCKVITLSVYYPICVLPNVTPQWPHHLWHLREPPAFTLPRVTKKQSKQLHAIYRTLKASSLSPGRTSRITAGTFSQVLRSLKVVEGRDYLDALPTAESLFSAAALGANFMFVSAKDDKFRPKSMHIRWI